MPLGPGSRLGPYEILAQLGAGGMGEVYRARDPRLDREVAIKILPEHLSNDSELQARFEREAKVIAALSHPNILAIYDFGSVDGVSYAVTELLQGETLGSRLTRGPIPWRKALEIGIGVADGLAAAHSKEILHRDIKPENVFLTDDGRVKILDFGLARYKPHMTGEDSSTAPTRPAETAFGVVMGTSGYMSPEQVCGANLDDRSDIFALGCVIFEMITGQRAFRRSSPSETASAILKDEPPELAKLVPDLPLGLDAVIAHSLEKKPDQRFHSAHDLAFALRHILSGSGSATAPLAVVRPSRRYAWVAVFLLLLALAGAAAYRFSRPKTIDSLAVLPFSIEGSDQALDSLSDRITENLINDLARTPRLRVAPRSSVFRYKGPGLNPEKAGRDLRVHAVLTGRLVKQGDAVNVQAELVDVDEESQIWGKQYTGRVSDAPAIGVQIGRDVAARLQSRAQDEDRERESWQKPRELLAAIQIKPGDTVADIGSGMGFMLPYLVEAVGPGGKVIAEDIQPDLVARLENRAKTQGWKNVIAVLGTDRNPHLAAGSVDVAFILMAYHDFEYPGEMLAHIREALTPQGRLVVVDRYQSQDAGHIRADRDVFAAEIAAAGFRLVSQFDHATKQYVLIFQKG